MVPYSFKTWAWLLGLQSEPSVLRSPFSPPLSQAHDEMQFALKDNIWSKHSPLSNFKEAWMYSLKDSSGCSRTFQSVLWNWSTHTTTWSKNMGLIECVGFHMPTTQRDPVSVICMMIHVLSSCHYRHKLFTPVSLWGSSSCSISFWAGLSIAFQCYFISSPAHGRDE